MRHRVRVQQKESDKKREREREREREMARIIMSNTPPPSINSFSKICFQYFGTHGQTYWREFERNV